MSGGLVKEGTLVLFLGFCLYSPNQKFKNGIKL